MHVHDLYLKLFIMDSGKCFIMRIILAGHCFRPKDELIFDVLMWKRTYPDFIDFEENFLFLIWQTAWLATIVDKNKATNDKFYRKVAFFMYTEMVNFRPQSWQFRNKNHIEDWALGSYPLDNGHVTH